MAEPEPLLTPADVEAWLALPQSTQRNMRSARRIPYLRLAGGAVRYRRADLERWLKEAEKPVVVHPPLPLGRPRKRTAGAR